MRGLCPDIVGGQQEIASLIGMGLEVAASGIVFGAQCAVLEFADVLIAAEDIDAMIFDAFSNPGAQMIEDRLFPFIEKIQAAKPGIPLIFMQTIYRESRNFCKSSDSFEQAKQDMAETLMEEAVKKYENVYFIRTNASDPSRDTSVDGTHPSDWGYMYWAKSIEKPVLKILKKHGLE